jgi:hypothetical protein
MLDRRRERLLASVLTAPRGTPKRAFLPPSAEDDSSRRRLPPWLQGASVKGRLIKEGQQMEQIRPLTRDHTPWAPPALPLHAVHA